MSVTDRKGRIPMKVILTADDGTERDITEHFRLLYDTVIASMDWGSGFLDLQEMLQVVQVGAAAGFADVGLVAASAGLERRFPDPAPGRPPPGTADPAAWATRRAAWVKEWTDWATRRDAWVKDEAARRFGDPPTWDGIQSALDEAQAKYDDTEGA
jgi:hypothetical protein